MGIGNIKERYVNFYTDYAFKRMFGTEANKALLIDFLNSLFAGMGVDIHIEEITYLPQEKFSAIERERRAIFDVYCRSNDGEYFIVEMQNARQEFFKDRTIYYSTFPIREEAERGDWNFCLPKIYSVNILNFCLTKTKDEVEAEKATGKEDSRYVRSVKLMDTKIKSVFYEKLTFVYLEMPKFKKELSECETLLDKWLFAIKHLSKMEDQPEELKSAIFDKLFKIAEVAKFSREEKFAYEESLNNMRDYKNTIETSFNDGVMKGRAEGRAEGRVEGRAEGRMEGAQEQRIASIRNVKKYMTVAQIAEAFGMDEEEVRRIIEE